MDTKTARKAVENMMFYLYNRFSESEANLLFGQFGSHMWSKFVNYKFDGFKFFGECDSETRDKLVERANQIYNK